MSLLRKHTTDESPATGRDQRTVRYLGASGYRRFSGEKRNREQSVSAEAWLSVVAAVVVALVLLGVWQETRTPKNEKPATSASTATAPASPR